jgi:hypothetical protein
MLSRKQNEMPTRVLVKELLPKKKRKRTEKRPKSNLSFKRILVRTQRPAAAGLDRKRIHWGEYVDTC